jgi:glutamyl-tRNA reductase
MSQYFAFGMNHRTAPVSIREPFELHDDALEAVYASAGRLTHSEWLIVSTCNRTEVYGYGSRDAMASVRSELERVGGPWPHEHAFELENDAAVRHVLEVAAGLQSQILGDSQILCQLKTAYRVASTAGTLGPWMHRLMHTAFALAKRLSSEAPMSGSIAGAAVTFATRTMRSRPAWKLLVVGAGVMARHVIAEMAGSADVTCVVVNRNQEKADQLAREWNATSGAWDDRHTLAADADVVIGATAADGPVLFARDLPPLSPGRHVLFVDLSVPRNLDPALAAISGCSLFNIDALSDGATGSCPQIASVLLAARQRCDAALYELQSWESEHATLQPAIRTLYDTFEQVREREVARNIHRFEPANRDDVDRLTRSIMQKLLAVPVVRLKTMASVDDDVEDRINVLNALFQRPEYPDEARHS